MCVKQSTDSVSCFLFTEKVPTRFLLYQAILFQFIICPLNLASVHRKLLRENGRRGQRLAGRDLFASDLRFDLLAHLRINRPRRFIFQLNIYHRSISRSLRSSKTSGSILLPPFTGIRKAQTLLKRAGRAHPVQPSALSAVVLPSRTRLLFKHLACIAPGPGGAP